MNTITASYKNTVTPTLIKPLLIDLIHPHSLIKKLVLTTGAAFLFGIASNMSIPAQPVPFSLQTLMVLLIGATLGRELAVLSMLQVILMGGLGLPMFANGSNTITAFLSPSAGYIYGFIISAYLAGWAAEKGLDRNLLTGFVAFAVAHQIIFVVGVVYLGFYLKVSMLTAFKLGYLPFMGLDLIKFLSAALIMYALWRVRTKNKV